MKSMSGWKSDLHAAKARETNDARARTPSMYSWSLARTETKLVLLPPTAGEGGADIIRRIVYRIPELTWDAERERWAVPLDEINVQKVRSAASWLPSANVSDGVRRYIRQHEAKAKSLSPMFYK